MSGTASWQGPSAADPSGDWNTASNWQGGVVPDFNDDVTLPLLPDTAGSDAQATSYTVTIDGANDTIADLAIDPYSVTSTNNVVTLAIDAGSLDVLNNFYGFNGHAAFVLSGGATFTINLGEFGNAISDSPTVSGASTLRFADGDGNLLNLQFVGGVEDQVFGLFPDGFQAPISGFTGTDAIAINPNYDYYGTADTIGYSGNAAGGFLTITGLGSPVRFQPPVEEPLLQLQFVGGYTAGNFRLLDIDGGLAIAFQLNEIDVTANHVTAPGTIGDDLFKVSASFDTIRGDGGNDTVDATGSYETIVVGSMHDGVGGPPGLPGTRTLLETINLGGRGNSVTIGDEKTMLTAAAGFDTITIGGGTSTLDIGGYTTVNAGRGDYTIVASGGNDSFTFADDLVSGGPAMIDLTLAGAKNSVILNYGPQFDAPFTLTATGGTGSGIFNVAAGQATITTGGIYNVFDLGALGSNTIATGSGHAKVTMETVFGEGANDTITLGGSYNLVQGYASALNLTGGTGSNSFVVDQGGDAPATVNIATGGMNNSFTLSNVNDNTITAGSGYDHVTIGNPVGSPAIVSPFSTPSSNITLAGLGNSVVSNGQNVDVTGGTGLGTFDISGGLGEITTGGGNNHFAVDGGGIYRITDPGNSNTFILSGGGDAELNLTGSNNAVFLGSGGSAGIEGDTSNLRLSISPDTGNNSISDFLADQSSGALIHLLGGVGGYATPQQVVAALQPIGTIASLLPLGNGYLVLDADVTTVKASTFIIG